MKIKVLNKLLEKAAATTLLEWEKSKSVGTLATVVPQQTIVVNVPYRRTSVVWYGRSYLISFNSAHLTLVIHTHTQASPAHIDRRFSAVQLFTEA